MIPLYVLFSLKFNLILTNLMLKIIISTVFLIFQYSIFGKVKSEFTKYIEITKAYLNRM